FGFADYDEVVSVGTNGKMTEVAAAMGITSLESMAEFTEVNRRNFECYRRQLLDVPGIALIDYPAGESFNYHNGRGGRRRTDGARPRHAAPHPVRGERHGPALLLPGMPPHGAVSHPLPRRRPPPPRDRADGGAGGGPRARQRPE